MLLKNLFKNFVEPYYEELSIIHGQCDSIIFPETFFLGSSFVRSWNLSTNFRAPGPTVLICKGV